MTDATTSKELLPGERSIVGTPTMPTTVSTPAASSTSRRSITPPVWPRSVCEMKGRVRSDQSLSRVSDALEGQILVCEGTDA